MARRKFEEARQLFQDILNTRLQVLPADHQDIAQTRYQLAGALRQLGRLEEAYQLQKDALKMLQVQRFS
jgi:tetratricopeptide (TPR) repeat protein